MDKPGVYQEENSVETDSCAKSSSVWSDELCSAWQDRRKSIVAVSGDGDTGGGVLIEKSMLADAPTSASSAKLPGLSIDDGSQLVLTAAHLVDSKSNILVGAFDDTGHLHHMDQASVLGLDAKKDLALLSVKFTRNPDIEPVAAGSFSNAASGAEAVAVRTDDTTRALAVFSVKDNSDFGKEGGAAIKCRDQEVKLADDTHVVVLSSAVEPGTSGSPLVGKDGKLLGIVSQRLPERANATHGIRHKGRPHWISSAAVSSGEIQEFLDSFK